MHVSEISISNHALQNNDCKIKNKYKAKMKRGRKILKACQININKKGFENKKKIRQKW